MFDSLTMISYTTESLILPQAVVWVFRNRDCGVKQISNQKCHSVQSTKIQNNIKQKKIKSAETKESKQLSQNLSLWLQQAVVSLKKYR